MPLLTRNSSKKQRLDSSSSEAQRNSKKMPQRRMTRRTACRRGAQDLVTVSADIRAHQPPKLAVDARASTEVEAWATVTAVPLTSALTAPSAAMPLKGHRRFNADLCELVAGCSSDLDRGAWSVRKIRAGEDDGSVEFELVQSRDQARIVVHLLCSDTSEYPKSHSFFCHSSEPESYKEQMKDICDGVLNSRPSTIHEVAKDILIRISCGVGDSDDRDDGDDGDGSDGGDGSDDYNHDDDISIMSIKPVVSRSALRRDFEGTHAAGYMPGIIWNGNTEFLLTVSVPVVELIEKIPAHVLMSWDNQFLLPRQHLVLVISGFRSVYPPIRVDGTLTSAALWSGTSLKFNVGFTRQYKPSMGYANASFRQYGLQFSHDPVDDSGDVEEELDNINDTFDKLSLSSSLESLLNDHFLQLLRLRQQFNLGWAAAEELHWRSQSRQESPAIIVTEMQDVLCQADEEEQLLVVPRHLPHDPLEGQDDHINLLETAFAYFLRRLTLCSRYCVVCHKKLDSHFEALKPYVCDSGLCAYQYYSLNFGPSLEYDICKNTEMVDLLVSLAYTAAAGNALDESLPRGLSLKIPNMIDSSLRDFDALSVTDMHRSIRDLIDTLPPIMEMKKHLEKRVRAGTNFPKLKDMDPNISPAAWSILRWGVASCTAHLQELTDEEDRVRNIGSEWRQFRFTVGAPDKEAKFRDALEKETPKDANARQYPTLYAFHGSPLKNWHSIIRHGLWYKTVTHGRVYGDGVYFAQDATTSTSYAAAGIESWKNSTTRPSVCIALAEIINLPHKFTSTSPYYVVKQTEWIMCRYLLVRTHDNQEDAKIKSSPLKIPFMVHDSLRQPLLGGKVVEIPQPSYKLQKLVALCKEAYVPPELDEEDKAVFNAPIGA